VLNSPASNSDGIVVRDKGVSSIQQNCTILQKLNISTLKMLRDGVLSCHTEIQLS
jgi:hypothetical protein